MNSLPMNICVSNWIISMAKNLLKDILHETPAIKYFEDNVIWIPRAIPINDQYGQR